MFLSDLASGVGFFIFPDFPLCLRLVEPELCLEDELLEHFGVYSSRSSRLTESTEITIRKPRSFLNIQSTKVGREANELKNTLCTESKPF